LSGKPDIFYLLDVRLQKFHQESSDVWQFDALKTGKQKIYFVLLIKENGKCFGGRRRYLRLTSGFLDIYLE